NYSTSCYRDTRALPSTHRTHRYRRQSAGEPPGAELVAGTTGRSPLAASLIAALVAMDSGQQSGLADVEAAIKLPQGRCYALVSDYLTYNKWQPAIVDVESMALPGITDIGSSFTMYYPNASVGLVPYTQTVSYVEEGRTFAYESDGLMRVKNQPDCAN
uniref:Subtilisin n=1 Tax=Macrostomum lignano TaxID=282301 RepID=A0A1I8FE73_9PLAT